MIGTTIKGRYRIYDEVGEGAAGSVYLARDQEEARIVAVKVVHSHLTKDGQFMERFQREANILAELKEFESPHIVRLYEFGEEDGMIYIVTEFVEGRTLAEILAARRTLEVDQALVVARQVAECLEVTSRKNIVHRDLKPANLMITPEGTVKVMDFGIARSLMYTGLTSTGVLGTPYYISPEQAEGSKDLDARTDMYSLGVCLYQMLTGELPYTGSSPLELILQHVEAPIPSVRDKQPDVPLSVDEIIRKCMAKRIQDRYAIPADLIAAIDEALKGEVAEAVAKPPVPSETSPLAFREDLAKTPVSPLSYPGRKRRWLPTALGIAGVVLVAAACVAAGVVAFQLLQEKTPTVPAIILPTASPTTPPLPATSTPSTEVAIPAATPTLAATVELLSTPTPTEAASVPPTDTPTLTHTPIPPSPKPPPTAATMGRIAYTIGLEDQRRYQIGIMNADGSVQMILPSLYISSPSFSPDGERVVFYAWEGWPQGNGLWTLKVDGTDPQLVIRDGEARDPRWSPDGKVIAYTARNSVHVISIHGGSPNKLADGSIQPSWSPDSQRLVFKGCDGPACGLFLISVDGSGKTRLTTTADDTVPSWSPDGSKVAFACKAGDTWDICTVNIDGSDRKSLTPNNLENDVNPAWLPDSSGIVFLSARQGRWEIWVMNADGSDQRKLVDAAVTPDWGIISLDTTP
ncbi:MAG: protein kinase [Anaerolineae bacterium]|nr:protein kinase [Anaerolineae bacterium]